jgi:predicted GIY-YIG superfamily endonuclease
MTDYDPPLESGLRGDRYPENDLELFVSDLADAHRPGVYCLLLSTPKDWKAVESAWQDAHDAPMPDYVRGAYDAGRVLYVGAAANVHARVTEHAKDEHTSAIESVFPPHSLWDVWFFEDRELAFLRESQIATELQGKDALADTYVHQR